VSAKQSQSTTAGIASPAFQRGRNDTLSPLISERYKAVIFIIEKSDLRIDTRGGSSGKQLEHGETHFCPRGTTAFFTISITLNSVG
jgi:hypothetical protein